MSGATQLSWPTRLIISRGSNLPYGFAAYIRWQIDSGDFLCRLRHHGEVSYCLSEQVVYCPDGVNSAVLSKRGTKVIEKKVKFHFGELYRLQTLQLALNMVIKTTSRFKVNDPECHDSTTQQIGWSEEALHRSWTRIPLMEWPLYPV